MPPALATGREVFTLKLHSMFSSYEVDFGKVNLNWCHSLSIELDEIQELVNVPEHTSLFVREENQYEVVGYTKNRKFLSVTFTLDEHKLVVDNVNLPSYETIRIVIIRQFLESTD
jgi:hypothetical protein